MQRKVWQNSPQILWRLAKTYRKNAHDRSSPKNQHWRYPQITLFFSPIRRKTNKKTLFLSQRKVIRTYGQKDEAFATNQRSWIQCWNRTPSKVLSQSKGEQNEKIAKPQRKIVKQRELYELRKRHWQVLNS